MLDTSKRNTSPPNLHLRSKSSPFRGDYGSENGITIELENPWNRDLIPVLRSPSTPQPALRRSTAFSRFPNQELPPLFNQQRSTLSRKMCTSSTSPPDSSSMTLRKSAGNLPRSSPASSRWSFFSTLDSSTLPRRASRESKGLMLAEWSQSESSPMSSGCVPSKLASHSTSITGTSTASIVQRSPSPTTSSRFPFFSASRNQASPIAPEIPVSPTMDPLYNLSMATALRPYPNEPTTTPSAYANLYQNASGTLQKLHTAYRTTLLTLHSTRADADARSDELAEAQTRAAHLKLQLDGLASRQAELDNVVSGLVEDLAVEKMARRKAEANLVLMCTTRGADVVDSSASLSTRIPHPPRDLRHKRQRPSHASIVSDSGFESGGGEDMDDGIDDASITTQSTVSLSPSSPSLRLSSASSAPTSLSSPSPSIFSSPALSETSMFAEELRQRQIVTAAYTDDARKEKRSRVVSVRRVTRPGPGTAGFPIDQGVVMGVLREENRDLRDRVKSLEKEVDGCLELVRGLGM